MRSSTIVAAFASLVSLASARIVGISVPDTIKPGDGFNLYIQTENYIQSVYDVAIAIGVAPGAGYPQSLGTVLDSFYLGPAQSNVVTPIPKWTTLPASTPTGPATLSAELFSLYGAVYGGTLNNYNVSITVGDHTSTTYVSSNS